MFYRLMFKLLQLVGKLFGYTVQFEWVTPDDDEEGKNNSIY
jgi:hypothetical protein